MGLSDRIKDLRKKGEDTAAEHKEQIEQAVGKAEVAADQRTEGRYHEQIAKAGAKAEAYVQNLKPEEKPAEEEAPTHDGFHPAP
jgi:DNA-binding protein H-NS